MTILKSRTEGAFDPETTSLFGNAFDKAWQTMKATRRTLAEESYAASTREVLASQIIAMGKQGERDLNRLVEAALASLKKFIN